MARKMTWNETAYYRSVSRYTTENLVGLIDELNVRLGEIARRYVKGSDKFYDTANMKFSCEKALAGRFTA